MDAVRCAVEIQRGMAKRNTDTRPEARIEFRIGVNLGDAIVEEHDIFWDGVNVAARLEALAEPGDICISRVVRDQIRDKLPYPFEDKGSRASRTSRGRCGSMCCTPKVQPPHRQEAYRPPLQVRRPCLRRAGRSSYCPSSTSATAESNNILPMRSQTI
jgi:Adenylate and Guanylate cyclase catalytic domain